METHPLSASLAWQNALWPEPATTRGDLDAGWISAEALMRPGSAVLGELLDYQTRFQRGLDPRTQAAYLIGSYSYYLSIAVAAPYLKASVLPDFSAPALAFRFEDYPWEFEGRTVTAKRTHIRFLPGRIRTDDRRHAGWSGMQVVSDRAALRTSFREMLEAHFTPLIDSVGQATRLPRAAQWRLVGDSVSAMFLDVGRRLGREAQAKVEAMAILKVPGSPLDNRQLHYFDLSATLGEGDDTAVVTRCFRSRGGCCRYYKTVGGHLCTTCVLQKPAERDRRLREAMHAELRRRATEPA